MTQEKYKNLIVMAVLAVTTLAVYWQVHKFDFINYDDDIYVSKNEHIRSGMTGKNITWVFTSVHGGNWHPITGLSHLLDCTLFDLNAGRHHLVNLLFHLVNTLLLFTVLRKMTAAIWQSAFVAALFALHTMHVESVAWISERKDVLSTFFWILTMAAYFSYVKKPNTARYVLTLVLFALGLMAKPMLVTLPFVLVLLDYWPLNRLDAVNGRQIYRLIREKIAFFVLSAFFCIITVVVQSKAGAIKNIEQFRLSVRAGNAVVSYVWYIAKMFCPVDLAVFYPHPRNTLPYWQIAASALLLIAITVWIARASGGYKYLLTGWFWYLGTLVPVIGLVQVGGQSVADRYTYIPSIGLFIVVTWGANDLLQKWKYKQIVLGLSAFAAVAILAVLTWFQVGCWHDSISLFGHAIEVTYRNNFAYNNRGTAYADKGESQLAISDFNKAIEINPKFANVYYNRGNVYKSTGRYDLAVADYNRAIEINPKYAAAYYNRALTYKSLGQYDLAIADYGKAIEINPMDADFYNNRGNAYKNKGLYDLAILDYNKAIEINPRYALAYLNKANVYELLGNRKEAVEAYKTFIKCAPSDYAPYIERAKRRIKALER